MANRAYGGMQAAPAGQREVNMKFKVVKVVGKGSYGTVYQVQRLSDGKTYALKEMDVRAMSQAEREDAANEIRLLASVQHPNVIAYNEAFLDGNRICIIMDFAPDGDLARVIKKYQTMKRTMPDDLVWKLFIQICAGLSALHSIKILHRDMKPGNIMIMPNDVAKIGDLGIAKLLSKTVAAKTQIGTPHYMPPEIWKNRPYGFQSDVWAVGCLLYEMLSLKVPFEARNINELRTKVTRGTYPPPPASSDRQLVELVKECLQQDPARRPTLEQILSSASVRAKMHLLPVPQQQILAPPNRGGHQMLDTIKVPRNFQMIKNKLPPAQYGGPGGPGDFNGGDDTGGSGEEDEVARLPSVPKPQQPSQLQLQQQQQQQQQQRVAQQQREQQQREQREQQQQRAAQQQRVAQAPLPAALQPARNAPQYGAPPARASAAAAAAQYGRVDPVIAEMQRKAAAIGNVYNVYNKQPQPAPRSEASAVPSWYQQQAPQISESRAAYGAFYHSPSTAAHARVQEQRAQQVQQQQQPYKGYYNPNNGGGQPQAAPNAHAAYNAGGARGGAYQPAGGRLQPLGNNAQKQANRRAGGDAHSQAGSQASAPPWNYRGGAVARGGGGGGALRAGPGGPVSVAGEAVARYPPMQWKAGGY